MPGGTWTCSVGEAEFMASSWLANCRSTFRMRSSIDPLILYRRIMTFLAPIIATLPSFRPTTHCHDNERWSTLVGEQGGGHGRGAGCTPVALTPGEPR